MIVMDEPPVEHLDANREVNQDLSIQRFKFKVRKLDEL